MRPSRSGKLVRGWMGRLPPTSFGSEFRHARRHECTGVPVGGIVSGSCTFAVDESPLTLAPDRHRRIPAIPRFDVDFDSHLFLCCFIPPLLFPRWVAHPEGCLLRDCGDPRAFDRPVVCTVAGWVPHPLAGSGHALAVAFALAAILAPTDPVAVSAITANSPLPSG